MTTHSADTPSKAEGDKMSNRTKQQLTDEILAISKVRNEGEMKALTIQWLKGLNEAERETVNNIMEDFSVKAKEIVQLIVDAATEAIREVVPFIEKLMEVYEVQDE